MPPLIAEFARQFEIVSGIVHRAESEAEAARHLGGIVRGMHAKRVALAGLPDDLHKPLAGACAEAGAEVLAPPFDPAAIPHGIDEADIGVTHAQFGLAETGTLVEIAANDDVRLVSSLPRTYVGIVYAADLLERLADAAEPIREAFQQHLGHVTVSFISGPSRTGDIELKLTLGVHGPETAHVIIIGP